MSSGIANGLNAMATNLFIQTNEGVQSLSTFGGIVAIFGGIALAVRTLLHLSQNGLCHLVAETKKIPRKWGFTICGSSLIGKIHRLSDS